MRVGRLRVVGVLVDGGVTLLDLMLEATLGGGSESESELVSW
jgi:hypothetical protein